MVLVNTLGRYVAMRFLGTVAAVFLGILTLVVMIDYIELMRRFSSLSNVSAGTIAQTSLFRVPQETERILSFCILTGAMSCYLNLSRRLELVVARAAGISAWQFLAPALVVAFLIGVFATTIYNPIAAILHERAKLLEGEFTGAAAQSSNAGSWVRQRNPDSQSIIFAAHSREQGALLGNVMAFAFDANGQFVERIEARTAILQAGVWKLEHVRVYKIDQLPVEMPVYHLKTSLTAEQVHERFATPETVPFWLLPRFIDLANNAGLTAGGYRLQYQKLLARPFLFAAMVLLAAAFSLRLFRFGGVQKMVLGGMAAGFTLFVISKVCDDLGQAELLHPTLAAWVPVVIAGFTGFVALLYQEDG